MRSANSTARAAFCSTSRIVTPSLAQLLERVEDEVDHDRREPERRLVEEQQPRAREQRARDRELLLLAARERRRRSAVVRSQDREALEDALRGRAAASSRSLRAVVPSWRFSATVSVPKMCRPSGTSASPRRTIFSGLAPTSDSPSKRIEPPAGATSPKIAESVVVLPAPFGPMTPTTSPSSTWSEIPCSAGMRP